jgi:tetratricopeptide (TPR) repeat protein
MARSEDAATSGQDAALLDETASAFRKTAHGLGDIIHAHNAGGPLEAGDSALRAGDLVRAGTLYMQAAQETPGSGEAWLGLARVLAVGGEGDRAQDLLDRAIAPEHKGAAWLGLAYVFATLGDVGRAEILADRAIALCADEPQGYALRAFLLQTAGNDAAALETLRYAVEHTAAGPPLWEVFITLFEEVSGPEDVLHYLDQHHDRVPRCLTVGFLTAQLCVLAGRMRDAEARMRTLVTDHPDNVELNIAFAKLLAELGDDQESIERLRALSRVFPHLPRPFNALADVLRGENSTLPDAIANLRHALSLEPTNATMLRSLSDCYSRTARYDEAADLLTLAVAHTPEPRVEDAFRLGTILRNAARPAEADRHLLDAHNRLVAEIARADDPADRHRRMAILARVLVALGDRAGALAQYGHMREGAPDARLSYDPELYLDETPGRLDRLREVIGGRDVLVLCHGPSVAMLDTWAQRFASLDVCIAALNRFRVFETGFLRASGRTIDLLLETQPKGVRPHIDHVTGFLERPDDNLLITARWVLDRLGKHCPTRAGLEARFDDKLLYYGGTGGIQPATPQHPLRFAYGNSLSTLVGLLTIGQARRIFLFGADGGVPQGARATHYGVQNADFRFEFTPEIRDTIAASLHADALDFRGAVEIGLVAAEGLFGTAPPPIFNVSPSSALQVFPRITYDQAWDMLWPQGQFASPIDIVRRWLHSPRGPGDRRPEDESRPR